MNTPHDPTARTDHPQVDQLRRRLAKGGLAAPIVMGTLLSRPVLGAVPHNCTVSGQISGNVSTHLQGNCPSLGAGGISYWLKDTQDATVTFWKQEIPSWVEVISNNQTNTRVFENTLKNGSKFSAVYTPFGGGNTNDVRLFHVLKGNVAGGIQGPNISLGQEAVVTLLNSLHGTKGGNMFPIASNDVILMFNAVIGGGTYLPTGWTAAQVLTYFQSLHT